jgi:hypothetical protein
MEITEQEKRDALEQAWRCPAMEQHGEFFDHCEDLATVFDRATGVWFCQDHYDEAADHR